MDKVNDQDRPHEIGGTKPSPIGRHVGRRPALAEAAGEVPRPLSQPTSVATAATACALRATGRHLAAPLLGSAWSPPCGGSCASLQSASTRGITVRSVPPGRRARAHRSSADRPLERTRRVRPATRSDQLAPIGGARSSMSSGHRTIRRPWESCTPSAHIARHLKRSRAVGETATDRSLKFMVDEAAPRPSRQHRSRQCTH